MSKFSKELSIILLISISLFIFTSLTHHHVNKIEEDNCILCSIITNVKDILNGYIPKNSLLALLIIFVFKKVILFIKEISHKNYTLINLKIRLND